MKTKINEALVIIDMQQEFIDEFQGDQGELCISSLIDNISDEIKVYKKKQSPIILVEYIGSGRTDFQILKAIGTYRKLKRIWKNDDDGSLELIPIISKMKLNRINVSGINCCACVEDTLIGIKKRLDIEVIVRKDLVSCYECFDSCYFGMLKALYETSTCDC